MPVSDQHALLGTVFWFMGVQTLFLILSALLILRSAFIGIKNPGH